MKVWIQRVRQLYQLVRPEDRGKIPLIALLMLVAAAVQTAGVGSIMPFLAVLSDPGAIERSEFLSNLKSAVGAPDTRSFLFFLGVAAFFVFTAGTALRIITQWIVTRFSSMQQFFLSQRLMEGYLSRPYEFFLMRNSGDLSKTVLQESMQAVSGGLLPAMRLLSQALLAILLIALIVAVKPVLAFAVATALTGIYGGLFLFAKSWLLRIGRERLAANRQRFTVSSEAFAGAKEIRLLGREYEYLQRFRSPSREFAMAQANSNLFQTLPEYALEAFAFGGIMILVLILMQTENGVAGALPLIGFYALAGKQLIPAFQKIFATLSTLRFSSAAVTNVLEELAEFRDKPLTAIQPQTAEIRPPEKSISLDRIRYFYPESDEPALRDIDLKITVNKTVGFVGSSGAGKSTLIDVILGLLHPQEGSLKIDGRPISAANAKSWQKHLGYVPQHIFLADQSIAANIALGEPEDKIDLAAVERAARLANLHDFICDNLPAGYDTVIGERGVRLSGGQRQRIGIARALYRDPPVLVFDEATSALDNATERAVMEAIHALSGKKTIILVAHRLSTVESCDRIFVLDGGEVVEEGSWGDLSSRDTHLTRLASGLA